MSTQTERANLAFVGLGDYAFILGKAAHKCANINIKNCFTRTPAKRQKFAETFGCDEVDSFAAICAADDIDGVVLATPNNVHAEQTVALAEAGKHVFVEKPICNTLADATQMMAACAAAKVVLAVGHQLRRSGIYRKWKLMIERGELGKPHFFEANHCGDLIRLWPEDDWRFQAELDADPLIHKGIHKLDLLNYLFGEPESVMTMAQPLSFNPAMSETSISAFRYASGLLGSFTCGFRYNHNTISIIGEDQSVFYSGYRNVFTVKNERNWKSREVECPLVDEIEEEVREFADAILGKAAFETDGIQARAALRLALAARKSARDGAPVSFCDFAQEKMTQEREKITAE